MCPASLASPLIAGTYALAGNAASVTYPAALAYGDAAALHDVVAGASTGRRNTGPPSNSADADQLRAWDRANQCLRCNRKHIVWRPCRGPHDGETPQ